jgi:hypothetical protein
VAYLVHYILERIGAVNGEADEQKIRLGIGKRSQSIVLLLSSCIPQSQLDALAARFMDWVGDVVLENSRHIFLKGQSRVKSFVLRVPFHTSGK